MKNREWLNSLTTKEQARFFEIIAHQCWNCGWGKGNKTCDAPWCSFKKMTDWLESEHESA